jgi:hypothetical protein
MIFKTATAGLLAIGAALGAGYYAISASGANTGNATPENFIGIDYVKIPPFAVPVIQNGFMEGYVVTEWVFTIDAKTKAALVVPPEVFIREDAFRSIYGEVVVDFENLDRVDLVALAETIRSNVNKRLGIEAITSALVQKFDFIPSEKVRDNGARGFDGAPTP